MHIANKSIINSNQQLIRPRLPINDPRSTSVIIPIYNSSTTLSRCLESVFNQSVPAAEIIVINDGSTDDSYDVALSFSDDIILINQDNMGQAGARNAGLYIAKGNYIAFLDADDYWLPDFIKMTTDFLMNNNNAVAVSVGQIHKIWGYPDVVMPKFLNNCNNVYNIDKPLILNNFFEFWAENTHITTGSALIRRSICEKAGGQLIELRISQDLEYWAYIATFGPWGFIPIIGFVTDGAPAVASQGWFRKYHRRRSLCPTVEQWQKRVLPRIKDSDMSGFRKVRGRVAAGYARTMILAGKRNEALNIIRKYGPDFIPGRPSFIMNYGANSNTLIWWFCCSLIQLIDLFKGTLFTISTKIKSRNR